MNNVTYRPRDLVHIGRVGAPHGVRGEMRVFPLTEDPLRFHNLTRCLLVTEDEASRREVTLRTVRAQGKYFLVTMEGVMTREDANQYTGYFLSVHRDQAIVLPPGRFFVFDLIGCEVCESGVRHGRLRDVLQTGANDVYVVARSGRPDLLIPVTAQVVRQVDLDARQIEVVLPEGLLEIYE